MTGLIRLIFTHAQRAKNREVLGADCYKQFFFSDPYDVLVARSAGGAGDRGRIQF